MITFKLINSIELRIMIAKTGKSIRQFANDIGVSGSYMSLILTGKRNPSANIAFKIANGLNLEVDQIFKVNHRELVK